MADHIPADVASWPAGREVVVAGGGTAGMSAARHLLDLAARVTIADDRAEDPSAIAGGTEIAGRGARFTTVAALLADDDWTTRTDLVIASPGFAPTHGLPTAAAVAGIPVWGEVELAWRLDAAGVFGAPRTWLVVTGTNGKTTTTSMLTDIVTASGRSAQACGNIGLPVLDAMAAPERVEVLCAELSSFQLHWAPSIAPAAGLVLNIADDHLDWHGSFDAYATAKQVALHGAIGVVGLDDPVASGLSAAGRRVGFTLGDPQPGELGVRDGVLVDRAFADDPSGVALVQADVIHPAGPSGLADALGAAALARAIGVEPEAVRAALTAFRPAGHRGEVVARIGEIAFVDDSKATNPHAAQAAVAAHRRVVLIAGGLLKGASLDAMLDAVGDRLGGVVAIGRDRGLVVDAIARHAPEVPTVTVFTGDDGCVTVARELPRDPGTDLRSASSVTPIPAGSDPAVAVMDRAVGIAWDLAEADPARPDAILLAPAAASLDMFAGYGRRGDAFATAARALADVHDASRAEQGRRQ
ncbi:UDP-N-acetylmuramoyl-L-alanine--D-glutamate ligase [Gordonia sp. NB41Y]|uniref:UDP-N-acetylmuramoyl-L-alanine--D-glutamate ligase n=1 Tax=Gordonia sp. NB41Y TaxID=875808 RepID=UPI0006B1D406|nr:UDP-N-acetylmuramoyl-L-alanine--D-glutamate ligase [Gordonia sp. NB41Y]KOY49538.1 UDP-N-acetylmuramoyl-L-alanyl-D-glutamate synthetase [Gordonia sp. NB41Y]WLP90400.1 UDP-N-acetylmuramoyl-L-alanine--D-glutamate ligase [Gordonia sp. NB41Y]